ncbi:MAG: neutral/alkaline non-lysosomal ceramidase N-terminal domain-containing protein [Chloroflexota bacterium]
MAPTQAFRAGVARWTITPPLTVPHAGWGAQTHVLPDGVDADLWATVLVVDDGDARAAFVDLDLVIVSREESDAIRREVAAVIGVEPTAVRVSVSHNHAGPPPSAWDGATAGVDPLRAYYESLPAAVAGAARVAASRLAPARVAAGAGRSGVAVNRRERSLEGRVVTGVNPDGDIDAEVLVVRIDTADGEPLAAIVGYTMHPTTMGPTSRLVSPDWPGYLRRAVETLTGAVCLFAQGATGDTGPGPDGFTDDLRVIRRLGGAVGAEAARVFIELRTMEGRHRHERTWESGAPLGKWVFEPSGQRRARVATLSRGIALPVRPQPPFEDAVAAARSAVDRLEALRIAAAPAPAIEAATFVAKRANMALYRSATFGGAPSFEIEAHLLRIGPAVFVGTECEPFSATGKLVKERSPFPGTWFGGYTGGWFGYVPTPDEYDQGGYEVDTSPYLPEAAAALAGGVEDALAELARSSPPDGA